MKKEKVKKNMTKWDENGNPVPKEIYRRKGKTILVY